MSLKKSLRALARKSLGVDVRSVQPFDDEFETLVHILKHVDTSLVLDVGANTGAFGSNLYRAGWTGRVVSFEPLTDAHALLREAAKDHPGWEVMPPYAIGDRESTVQFNVAGNSSSSSLLPMADLHVAVAPKSAVVSKISVHVKRLDDALLAMEPTPHGRYFLKVDTQGSESAVLDGATRIMPMVVGIRTEMSFAELYKGQALFDGLYTKIKAMGFDIWDVAPVLRDPESGRMLQCDATFLRTDLS